jgi:hypothetical protein
VGVSIVVYFLAATVFAAALPAETLMSEYGSMKRVSAFGIYHYLKRTSGPARWADSRRSYHLQRNVASMYGGGMMPAAI